MLNPAGQGSNLFTSTTTPSVSSASSSSYPQIEQEGVVITLLAFLASVLFCLIVLLLLPYRVQTRVFRCCCQPREKYSYIAMALYKARHSMYRKEIFSKAMRRATRNVMATAEVAPMSPQTSSAWTQTKRKDLDMSASSGDDSLGKILYQPEDMQPKSTIVTIASNSRRANFQKRLYAHMTLSNKRRKFSERTYQSFPGSSRARYSRTNNQSSSMISEENANVSQHADKQQETAGVSSATSTQSVAPKVVRIERKFNADRRQSSSCKVAKNLRRHSNSQPIKPLSKSNSRGGAVKHVKPFVFLSEDSKHPPTLLYADPDARLEPSQSPFYVSESLSSECSFSFGKKTPSPSPNTGPRIETNPLVTIPPPENINSAAENYSAMIFPQNIPLLRRSCTLSGCMGRSEPALHSPQCEECLRELTLLISTQALRLKLKKQSAMEDSQELP